MGKLDWAELRKETVRGREGEREGRVNSQESRIENSILPAKNKEGLNPSASWK